MALSPEILRMTIFFYHLVENRHTLPIDPLVFKWVNIDQSTLSYIPNYSNSVSWQTQNSRKMALSP